MSASATRILVVDDERYLADLVATALRYEGFETAVVGTGQAAVASVESFGPHLIVLDVMLPDCPGPQQCSLAR
jgi:two-component system OmpR family response regulator